MLYLLDLELHLLNDLIIYLADSTSTNGQVKINGTPFLHGFNSNNTFVGPSAGNFSTAGFNVTAVGYNAANATASGDGHIVAIGDNAIRH